VKRVWVFTRCVVRNFRRNNGLLIAGALGYNALLSIVPLIALVLVILTAIVDEQVIIESVSAQTEAVFPGGREMVVDALEAFLERREVIGGVGLAGMLFFSTIGFRMLADAMAAVFGRDRPSRDPHWVRGVVLPLAYVGSVMLGILLLTFVMFAFDLFPGELALSVPLVKFLAFLGLVALLASFYWLMPGFEVRPRVALIGGAIAATLWEAVRSTLMWYFANLSLVHMIYGSLAAVVVVLVSLEVAAIILLLVAEVLAELERRHVAGKHWYEPLQSKESES
jgi:YihY family inner membrane protein